MWKKPARQAEQGCLCGIARGQCEVFMRNSMAFVCLHLIVSVFAWNIKEIDSVTVVQAKGKAANSSKTASFKPKVRVGHLHFLEAKPFF